MQEKNFLKKLMLLLSILILYDLKFHDYSASMYIRNKIITLSLSYYTSHLPPVLQVEIYGQPLRFLLLLHQRLQSELVVRKPPLLNFRHLHLTFDLLLDPKSTILFPALAPLPHTILPRLRRHTLLVIVRNAPADNTHPCHVQADHPYYPPEGNTHNSSLRNGIVVLHNRPVCCE